MTIPTSMPASDAAARQDDNAKPQGSLFIGDWVLDAGASRLRRGEGRQETRLEPKVADLLVYLARHRGQVVSREELEATVWRGTVVSYDSVTGAVQKLRKALGDDRHRPRYIETLSKRGYRFIAPVHTGQSDPADSGTARQARHAPGLVLAWPAHHKRLLDAVTLLVLIALTAAGLWLSCDPPAPKDTSAQRAPVRERHHLALLPVSVGVLSPGNRGAGLAAVHPDVGVLADTLAAGNPPRGIAAASGGVTCFATAEDTDTQTVAEALAALAVVDESLRGHRPVSPSDYHLRRGQIYDALGCYAEAVAAFRQGLESDPTSARLHLWLAASLVEVGALDEAEWEVGELLLANPEFAVSELAEGLAENGAGAPSRLARRLRRVGLAN